MVGFRRPQTPRNVNMCVCFSKEGSQFLPDSHSIPPQIETMNFKARVMLTPSPYAKEREQTRCGLPGRGSKTLFYLPGPYHSLPVFPYLLLNTFFVFTVLSLKNLLKGNIFVFPALAYFLFCC